MSFGSIDQDLPLEVDDEYWYHPDPREAFKQPEGVPSSISAFNALIRLMKLMPNLALVGRIVFRGFRFKYLHGVDYTLQLT